MWNLKDLLLYKVLLGWLECLRILVREEFQGFEFPFSSWNKQNKYEIPQGVLKLKTAWYFCYKNKREKKKKDNKRKKWKLLGKKRCQSPIDFLLILIVLRNPLLQLKKSVVDCRFRHQLNEVLRTNIDSIPSPTLVDITYSLSHFTIKSSAITHGITCTEISDSALYSYLVWIMCCYSGFCRW